MNCLYCGDARENHSETDWSLCEEAHLEYLAEVDAYKELK